MAGVAIVSCEPTLVDAGDRWQLRVRDAVIDQCCFGYAVVLQLSEGAAVWEIRIEQPFAATTFDGAEHLVVPEEDSRLQIVLSMLRSTVESAEAIKDGHFVLRCSGGDILQIPPDEGFEAWTVVGPGGIRLVSLPGGELGV